MAGMPALWQHTPSRSTLTHCSTQRGHAPPEPPAGLLGGVQDRGSMSPHGRAPPAHGLPWTAVTSSAASAPHPRPCRAPWLWGQVLGPPPTAITPPAPAAGPGPAGLEPFVSPPGTKGHLSGRAGTSPGTRWGPTPSWAAAPQACTPKMGPGAGPVWGLAPQGGCGAAAAPGSTKGRIWGHPSHWVTAPSCDTQPGTGCQCGTVPGWPRCRAP